MATQRRALRLSVLQQGHSHFLGEQYLLSLDQGTSSSRAIVFKRSGEVLASHQIENIQIYPFPGQVEHDPEEIWRSCVTCLTEVLRECGLTMNEIAAIGITNQRETTVVWDRLTGKPFYNAIVWNDTRTIDICKRLAVPDKNRFKDKTGLPLDCYFSLSKLVYLLETVPGLRAAAEKGDALFGTIDCFLLWKLSAGGVHKTDVSNASRTMLMNLHTLSWDDEIMSACGIPRSMLPEICPSVGEFCLCSSSAVECLAGVPISAVLGDQQAALFGQGCFSSGDVKCTYGTGAFLLMNTGENIVQSSHGLLTSVAFQVQGSPPIYALEGSVKYCGSVMQWMRDNLELFSHSSELEALARMVENNGGVYFVPAFSGLGAPHWDETARGTLIGLTAFNQKAHLVRAALEASAFQVKQSLAAMQEDSGIIYEALKVDGGVTVNGLLMQFQANLLEVPLILPVVSETTALGAALAAGLAQGLYASLEDVRTAWQIKQTYTPDADSRGTAYAKDAYKIWLRAVERSRNWLVDESDETAS